MSARTYVNFDLMIEKTGDEYRARVLNSPAGEATITFKAPFSALELENFTLRLGQSQRRVRRIDSPEMQNAKLFGQRLFKTVFAGDVGACMRSSMTQAALQDAGLRLRLRLSDARDLMDIPWEYLYDEDVNRFLSLSIETPLVRYLDQTGHITPLLVTPPLKVLAVISSPTDFPQLNAEDEWRKLQESVADLESVGLLKLERLDVATLEQLQRQLRRDEYHVFHFIGHGGFDEVADDGVLLMEDENGRGRAVSGQTLGMLMHDEKSLRLALLNACEGGRTSATDPFSGVGQSLLQQGIPAVIAMQREVTDDTAITMAHAFYAALADGYPVDAALTEARKSIFVKNDLEWGTPVLYMRSPDGRIFDVDQAASAAAHASPAKEVTPSPLLSMPSSHTPAQENVRPAEQTSALNPPVDSVPGPPVDALAGAPAGGQTAPASTPSGSGRRWMGVVLVLLGLIGAGWGYWALSGTHVDPPPANPEPPTADPNGDTNDTADQSLGNDASDEQNNGDQGSADQPPVDDESPPNGNLPAAEPPDSQPVGCVAVSDPPIRIGDVAQVCTTSGDRVSVRSGPGIEYAQGKYLSAGDRFEVIGGPTCGNYGGQQFNWWQIRVNGDEKWIVDGKDSKDDKFICRSESLQPTFGQAVFCADGDDNGRGYCSRPGASLPSGITKFWINWPFENLPVNTRVDRRWFYNGAPLPAITRERVIWDENQSRTEGVGVTSVADGAGLPDGVYTVKLYLSGQDTEIAIATVRIGDSADQGNVPDFSGTWDTNFARMTLRQSGNSVSGTYRVYGGNETIPLEGTIHEQTLSGNYRDDPNRAFSFTMLADGNSFDGYWQHPQSRQRYLWCGARNQALPDGCGFSGYWNTNISGVNAWVRLTQTGDQVQGRYSNSADTGSVSGQVGMPGRGESPHYSVYGDYDITIGGAPFEGTFRFDLLDFDSQQFQGCFQSQTTDNRAAWCGWREGARAPAQCMATSCP